MEQMISLLKDWLIPLGSIAISIWFASSAKKDAERAERVLDQVSSAIQGWQSQLNNSAIGILDSLPQVVEGKSNLAKMQAIHSILETLRERSKSQEGLSANSYEQLMKALTLSLDSLSNGVNGKAQPDSQEGLRE
jgi:hypothetical protein